jgi:hypothetical protein
MILNMTIFFELVSSDDSNPKILEEKGAIICQIIVCFYQVIV